VAGELGGDGRLGDVAERLRAMLERGRDATVQRGVLAGQQVVVHGLADERVAEPVRRVGPDHEHVVGDGLARALHRLGGGEPRDRLEQPVRDRPVEHRRGAHDCVRDGREPLDAREQHVAQRLGQQPAVAVNCARRRSRLGIGRQQLLGEQRVAERSSSARSGWRRCSSSER